MVAVRLSATRKARRLVPSCGSLRVVAVALLLGLATPAAASISVMTVGATPGLSISAPRLNAADAVLVAVVAAMLLTSRPSSADAIKAAPGLSLVDTAGTTHTLSQRRSENVMLYFSEGAGC